MNAQWKIREAEIDDAPGLESCMSAAYAMYEKRFDGLQLPPMTLDYADEIRNHPTWVAAADEVVAGGLTMTFDGDNATISNIAVHPEFQGQGLGGGLMSFAEAQARDRGYTVLRLATHVRLKENVELYRHLGWNETNRDDTRVYMSKTLDS
ncbi:MAG: GNAT family N-acetyltransferase [Candidatus Rariloculaceae bacterium]